MQWPAPVRILFATASPDGVGPVPADAHLLALRQVIEPWIAHFPPEERRTRIAEHLAFLPQARLDSIQSALAGLEYTHVHLLAHGVPIDKAGDRRFGLALEDGVADGERLASVLRTRRRGQPDLVRPAVVTLAACDAGQVGSVVGAGASIAHALHEEGIPLVVASQFPLSFAGSVVLTQVLYEGFWSGADPRLLLNDLYRQLQIRVPQTHDWASVVAYAAFPADLDDQLREVPLQQAKRRLDSALHYADRVTRGRDRPAEAELERLVGCVEDAQRQMGKLLDPQGPAAERAGILSLLAATEKRLAEILGRVSRAEAARASLEEARKLYKEAFDADPSQDWCLVQMLSLTAVLRGGPAVDRDLWELARIRSEQELRIDDRRRRAWALGNLVELYLLSLLLENPPADARKLAHQYTRDLLELMGDSFEVHSTRRQLLRYCEFFRSEQPGWDEVVRLAMDLAGALPV
jgi:tetratricopeptide (TPR) repeat protein